MIDKEFLRKPEEVWQALLDLPSEDHDWPEVFLQAFHRRSLAGPSVPVTYPSLVRRMVLHALGEPGSEPRWPYFEDVWEAILGLDGFTYDLWEERHQGLVTALADVFDAWMARAPMHGRRLNVFARWLSRRGAVPLRLRALPWLARVLVTSGAAMHDADKCADAVAGFLNVVWSENETELRRQPEAFAAFRSLLKWLSEEQNTLGLELLGRLGSLS